MKRLIVLGACLSLVAVGVAIWLMLAPRVVSARLPDVEGLQVGSPVKAAELHAGDVSGLRPEGNLFAIEVELGVDLALKSDACARLITLRTGESYLELETGTSERMLAAESVIPPCAIARAESFVESLAADSLRHAEEATRRIQALGSSPIVYGVLEDGDSRLGGKPVDTYTFNWMEGQDVAVDVRSSEVDPFVIVQSPSGWQQNNDDASPTNTNAQLELIVRESGTWYVHVTCSEPGERGRYELVVR